MKIKILVFNVFGNEEKIKLCMNWINFRLTNTQIIPVRLKLGKIQEFVFHEN